ncbi:MAG: hypothetical protein SWK76_07525 [Actinomycetota bacterium]|nr:hypothetical protein [Actinomycetota bacterium]
MIFDPFCGRKIVRGIEGYIAGKRREGSGWKKAYLVAGHSHLDHAKNFYLPTFWVWRRRTSWYTRGEAATAR